MNKIIRMPFEFAIFLEILLIVAGFENSQFAVLAIINGILIFWRPIFNYYILTKTYKKIIIPSNRKQAEKLNRVLFRNYYKYSKYNNITNFPAKVLFDIRTHVYSNSEINSFINICSINNKNIIKNFVEFSKNYNQEPKNIVHNLCITDNQIRFLVVIAKIYNLKIITINKKFSENMKKIEDEKEKLINNSLYILITINKLLNRAIRNNENEKILQEINKIVHQLLDNLNDRDNVWNRTI